MEEFEATDAINFITKTIIKNPQFKSRESEVTIIDFLEKFLLDTS
jgi:hypothetical protein